MDTFKLKTGIQTFSPDYFALAMSTGIISIASSNLGYSSISHWLFVLNNVELILLSVIFILRLAFFFQAFKKDIYSHARGAGFLTIVAASCILGLEYILYKDHYNWAIILWYFSLAAWLVLLYSFFILVTTRNHKPSLERGLNGSWLLFVVSAQALSILGSFVSPHLNLNLNTAIFINLLLYLLGVLFYIVLIGIIFYRTAFITLKANEFKPSFWIDMGAAAISTLSGVLLVKSMSGIPQFSDYISTIKVFNALFWTAGSWWIPAIFFLEIWRHKSIPLKYTAGYWSLVFPLGVYTVCTWHLGEETGMYFLKDIASVFIYVAWLAWLIIFIPMCIRLIKVYFLGRTTASPN